MKQRGQRTIDGKVYNLGGRVTGLNAKATAQSEAKTKRARGHLVRLVTLATTNYQAVQELQKLNSN